MLPNSSVLEYYQQIIDRHLTTLSELKNKRKRIGWIRLLIFSATILSIYAVRHDGALLITATILIGSAAFLFALSLDIENKKKIENTEILVGLNNDEVSIINNHYTDREDGKLFEPAIHAYANDLDIFGKASVYQYVNRCNSQQGKQLLATNLLAAQLKEPILLQQQAVKELGTKTDWYQQFQAYGITNAVTLATEQKINNWLQEKKSLFTDHFWEWFVNGYSVVTIGCGILYSFDILNYRLFYLLVLLFLITGILFSKKIHTIWLILTKVVNPVNTLYEQLNWLEKEPFKSEHIIGIKGSIKNEDQLTASHEILQLKKILDRFDIRLNGFVFLFLNTFLLWDLRQIIALNKWKKKNALKVPYWFAGIAQMEVSISIATLAFNQPDWCFPKIADEHFTLQAKGAGHPLLSSKTRVDNDYSSSGSGKISIITGSNMGGKSTFLRSIGVNIVLALMGAPVCAVDFTVSPVKLMSSMRIADNLAESTSTFYAELKKLQTIIEAVNRKEKIFILLDEILRGTNSLDKHTGSEALIKQLIKQQAVAILATHDIELTSLHLDYPMAISNYHFDVQVSNDELYFDYKLKEGICKSLNASILMKKIGIEV
jgi:hypothetical protein